MATVNVKAVNPKRTHEGAVAHPTNAEQDLRRSVMACLLWEDEFYESGETIASRIKGLIPHVKSEIVRDIAIEAREKQNLRHVPLLLARELARNGFGGAADLLARIIQRADELTEFLSIYWLDGRQPLSAQVKKGLAKAFGKFNEYQLGKYNRDNTVKLRDVLFLSHAKPKDAEQAALWKRLIDGTLVTPDTWEVSLSGGKDKKETWERLLSERKLGGLALLRNLRNMQEAKVSDTMIRQALAVMNTERILPFRFVAAAKYAPRFEPELEAALLKSINLKLNGKTVILVDGSGSMDRPLSDKSDMTRFDAASALAMIAREMSNETEIFVFSQNVYQVPPRRGFALRDAIKERAEFGSTNLGAALNAINKQFEYDRIIVVTDEQSADRIPNPNGKGYMINVASAQNGIGYGAWTHIDGFSEAVFNYILVDETTQ
jgi:60 kDa SS-A/Ro ribonucleoprotein